MSIEKKNRLAASSVEDLKVLSFLCQDAIVSSEEVFFDKKMNLFIATFSRFCWEKEETNHNEKLNYRVVSGLQIKNVEKITYKNFKSNIPFLNLLTFSYSRSKITLKFSMSVEIILHCKKIDVLLEDLDIPWPTKLKPKHK
tara:strand:+ start:127 stop:549 length:423 start_codon:yes stop_codon:yes gene_type:complete